MTDQECELNRRAFFAVKGYSLDWAGDLIRLLRSTAPIAPEVREVLAEALDQGTLDGTRLVLNGNKINLARAKGFAAREQAINVIEAIERELATSNNGEVGKAIERVAVELAVGVKNCDRIWYQVRPKYEQARSSMRNTKFLNALDEDSLKVLAMATACRPNRPGSD